MRLHDKINLNTFKIQQYAYQLEVDRVEFGFITLLLIPPVKLEGGGPTHSLERKYSNNGLDRLLVKRSTTI